MDEVEKSKDAKNCFFMNINLEKNGLTVDPSLSFNVKAVDYNGTCIDSDQVGTLRLLVLAQKDYIFMRKERCFIDKMIVPCHAIQSAYFDSQSYAFVFVFQKGFGYWSVKLLDSYTRLYNLLQDNRKQWITEHLKLVSLARLSQLHERELLRRENSYKDPVTESQRHDTLEVEMSSPEIPNMPDDVLRNGFPSQLLPEKEALIMKSSITDSSSSNLRMTRSKSSPEKLLRKDFEYTVDFDSSDTPFDKEVEETEPIETPAPFDPPLTYSINSTKNFTITANDFKTLYNASWVNDTLIDFFIAYEIERAITELHTITRSEVYAFNSFFYTKLVSSTGDTEEPRYYENIRKWLEKIDLCKFNYIVIPIMENAHWFCVVIKGLPLLLALAKVEAESGARAVATSEPETDHDPNSSDTKANADAPDIAIADIFVLDSLRLTHPQTISPIKTVLREHCKEKHGVAINTNNFKVRYSRVTRQRNTSDCGIHVIFNLKKWLSEPLKCEQMWRKRNKSTRYFSEGQKLRLMRKNCIELLLKLHSEQPPPEEGRIGDDGAEAHSDDDIEEISYHNSESTVTAKDATQLSSDIKVPETTLLSSKADVEQSGKEVEDLQLTLAQAVKAKEPADSTAPILEEPHVEIAKLSKRFDSALRTTRKASIDCQSDSQLSNVEDTHDSDFSRLILDRFMDNPVEMSAVESASSKESSRDPEERDVRTATEQLPSSYYNKTLDPRVSEKADESSSDTEKRVAFVQIEHPQLRRLYMRLRLSKDTMRFLNKIFSRHEKVYNPERMSAITELVEAYDACIRANDSRELAAIEEGFRVILKDPPEPKDASFVIGDEHDRDLNRSVGDLRIADEVEVQHENADVRSEPLQIGSHIRVIFSNESRNAVDADEGSDIEVLSREVILSSPRQRTLRSEHKSKKTTMRIISPEIELVTDSDGDDLNEPQRLKTRHFTLNSPKRRRLDRSF